jgi:hypothetical protein
MILATAFLINTAVVTVTMVIHYEALFWLSKKLPKLCQIRPRLQVLVGVLCVFIVHVIEIWLFAFAFYFSSMIEGMGKLTGNLSEGGGLLDCVYFSFVTFTTVGYGDVVAEGRLRYLGGIESLTGIVLITWSASFLFVEMQRNWADLRKLK